MQQLQDPAAWRELQVACDRVETIETHRAWVFLAGDRALKLKKACRDTWVDFSTPARREAACREEVRLNRRLAPDIYLGVIALGRRAGHPHVFDDPPPRDRHTAIDDWAVLMQRLPAHRMLDRWIASSPGVQPEAIEPLAAVLAAFWARSPEAPRAADEGLADFLSEHALNCQVLTHDELGLRERSTPLLRRFEHLLHERAAALQARDRTGWVRDGHGDLRPEHVALIDPPVVIDALEFSARLRAQDPFDELAYLALECERLGAGWIGAPLIHGVAARLQTTPPAALMDLYTAHRGLLRARLSLAHLLEQPLREPKRWRPQADRYLALVEQALTRAGC